MSRFARQTDLFAPAAPSPEPEPDPIAELDAMLRQLRAASVHPWMPLPRAVELEYQAQALGRRAGATGERLVSAILAESERLFAAEESAG